MRFAQNYDLIKLLLQLQLVWYMRLRAQVRVHACEFVLVILRCLACMESIGVSHFHNTIHMLAWLSFAWLGLTWFGLPELDLASLYFVDIA